MEERGPRHKLVITEVVFVPDGKGGWKMGKKPPIVKEYPLGDNEDGDQETEEDEVDDSK